MRNFRVTALCIAVIGACAIPAHAAPPQGGTLVAQAEPSCQKEVKDYLGTLQFIRQSSGSQIGGRVEQAYINEKDLNQLVAQQGHCAAARVLRERGAPR